MRTAAPQVLSAMLLLLSLAAPATLALPLSDQPTFLGTSSELLARLKPRTMPLVPMLHGDGFNQLLSSPSSPAARSRPARSFLAPRTVPLPFLHPRVAEEESGEQDEDLEDLDDCGEAEMHDCYVRHARERQVEQQKGSGVPRLAKRELKPSLARRLPSRKPMPAAGGAKRRSVEEEQKNLSERMVNVRR